MPACLSSTKSRSSCTVIRCHGTESLLHMGPNACYTAQSRQGRRREKHHMLLLLWQHSLRMMLLLWSSASREMCIRPLQLLHQQSEDGECHRTVSSCLESSRIHFSPPTRLPRDSFVGSGVAA